MEQNGTGDNDSEILRDIEDIINVTAISQMTTQQQNLNFQQPARQTQQPIHPPHITHLPPSTSSPAFVNIPNTMPKEAHKQNKIRSDQKPYIRIIEQPSSNPFRFRYPCEGRTAGKIPGANSTEDKKTFPTVEIVGYTGEVLLVVSCVTKDEPYKPHPHNLVGKDCKDGICRMTLKGEPMRACFSNLGIQCAKKNDVTASLDVRERIDVDPFNTRFDHKNRPSEIDLNTVRLCFQAFYNVGGSRVSMEPVVSDKIYKNSTDLIITRLCSCAAKVGGGDEIILLCEKVNKDDIKIRFIEVEDDNTITWEAFGEFNQQNVHKQTAIAFRTPRYKSTTVNDKAKVFIQLLRPSDGMTSKALPFEFFPDPGMRTFSRLQRKLKRKEDVDIFEKILSLDSEATATKYSCPFNDPEDESNNTVSSDCSASNAQSSETLNEFEAPLVLESFEKDTQQLQTQQANGKDEKFKITEIEFEVPQINCPLADDSTQTSTPMEEIFKQQHLGTQEISMLDKVCEWMRSSEFERTDSLTVENGDALSMGPQTDIDSAMGKNPYPSSGGFDEDRSFNELMEHMEQFADGSHSRRDVLQNPILKELPLSRSSPGDTELNREIHTIYETGASAQASVDIDEAFDETSTYNSLRIALKNPVEIPMVTNEQDKKKSMYINEEDGLVVLTNPPAPKIKVNAAQTPPSPPSPPLPLPPRTPSPIFDQKLPPLPPKPRTSQDFTSGEHSPVSSVELRTRNSSLSSSRPPSQIIIMRTPDQSPTKRSDNTPTPSPKKRQGFFSRFFSRRKSKSDSAQGEEVHLKSPTPSSGSREPSIGHFSLNDTNRASLRSVKSLQPSSTSGNYSSSLTAQNSGVRSGKPVGRSSSSVSGKRPAHLNADVIHIPLKGGSASSLAHRQDEGYSNASTLTFGHHLDRKTLSALQLADIPITDGKMELLAIADRQSIKNLCEGAYGVVLDPGVDLGEAEHFALYTSIPDEGDCSATCQARGEFCPHLDESQIISPDEIARRLAEANGL